MIHWLLLLLPFPFFFRSSSMRWRMLGRLQDGDPTAKWAGRLTLNPSNTSILSGPWCFFLQVLDGGDRSRSISITSRTDEGLLFVSSAGILANILFAFVALLFLRLFSASSSGISMSLVNTVCQSVAYINITLAALNLIPILPWMAQRS